MYFVDVLQNLGNDPLINVVFVHERVDLGAIDDLAVGVDDVEEVLLQVQVDGVFVVGPFLFLVVAKGEEQALLVGELAFEEHLDEVAHLLVGGVVADCLDLLGVLLLIDHEVALESLLIGQYAPLLLYVFKKTDIVLHLGIIPQDCVLASVLRCRFAGELLVEALRVFNSFDASLFRFFLRLLGLPEVVDEKAEASNLAFDFFGLAVLHSSLFLSLVSIVSGDGLEAPS